METTGRTARSVSLRNRELNADDTDQTMTTVQCLRDPSQLIALESEWNELADGHPLRSPAWLLTWWEKYIVSDGCRRRRSSLFVPVVRDSRGRLVGLAPWYVERGGAPGWTVRFLGDGQVCTDHATVLADPEQRTEVSRHVARWLVDAARGRQWHRLWLEGVDADDPTVHLLLDQMRQRGAFVQSRAAVGTWGVELPASWDEYLQSLSKNHRKKCRRLHRQYIESGEVKVCIAQSVGSLDDAMQVLHQLHNRRRRSLGEPGIFESARFRAFHQLAASRLCSNNQLALLWLQWQGRPVAAEYLLCSADTVFTYQSGMEPDVTHFSPGNMAVLAVIRWSISTGRRRLDFLRGDEAYKRRWKAVRRDAVTLSVRPAGWLAGVEHAVTLAGRSTRTVLRAMRNRVRTARR